MKWLIIAIAVLSTGAAHAQTKIPVPAPKPAAAVDQLWQKLISANVNDLTYAKALADAANTAGGKIRSACITVILNTVSQANGETLKDENGNTLTKPNPAAFTLLEQVSEIGDALQPTSPLVVACVPAANALKMSITQLITMAIAGTASLSALGVALP